MLRVHQLMTSHRCLFSDKSLPSQETVKMGELVITGVQLSTGSSEVSPEGNSIKDKKKTRTK